jgi:hypothetical protein
VGIDAQRRFNLEMSDRGRQSRNSRHPPPVVPQTTSSGKLSLVRRHLVPVLLAVASVSVAACVDDGPPSAQPARPAATTVSPPESTPPPTTAVPSTVPAELPAPSLTLRPGTEQLAVLDASPGTRLDVIDADGEVSATGTVDEAGALLFRNLAPGTYRVATADGAATEAVTVAGRDDVPPPSLYREQRLGPGFGYLTTRDGTTLSINVALPGDPAAGPYPTVVEYSGYDPSNPDNTAFGSLFNALGYAYVGVNMRGTGCSGGSYRFFEIAQSLDGYDAIETIAAQPWVAGNRVGMVGVSYPGISQLFVAATRPPSLAAITPLSVLDDAFGATLYPGGLLNTGFAVEWTAKRMAESRPFGQEWTRDRADGGDDTCAANQQLRLQNPDLVAEIRDNPFYTAELGDSISPRTFVDRIEVPVFIAGAWQDEQTGGRFPTMLDRFTSAPHVYATLVNGGHTESIGPGVFPRFVEFLDLYVGRRVPDVSRAAPIAGLLAGELFGTAGIALAPDRFDGSTYEAALAAFEAEPPIRVLFEEGAADGTAPGTPLPRYTASFDAWPVPEAADTRWFLGPGGTLSAQPPAGDGEASSYTAEPDALPAVTFTGSESDIWLADATYDWRAIPAGTGVGFVTDPLATDTVVVGSGSADLWITSSTSDTDLEVTITEVRPDGQEMYVQSGWLRASRRALDDAASTPTRPRHTHLRADAAPLPDGGPTLVRVELFPVAHAFRAGSRLRLTIDAPGNNRPVWAFATISDGETVTVSHDADHPSAIVLPVVSGVDVPAGVPACGAVRAQPCRAYVAP